MIFWRYAKRVCFVIFILSIAMEYGLLRFNEKRAFMLAPNIEIVSIEEADSPELTSEFPEYSEDIEKFKEILPVFDESKDDFQKAKELLGFIGNAAKKVGNEITSKSPFGMYQEISEGKGALCWHMAFVYLTMLKAKGVKARRVHLRRDILFDSYDGHTTVDVYIPKLNKWVMIDPTFNAYFLVEGLPASATDLHMALLGNNVSAPKDIRVVKLQEVSYPADIEKYYINPLLLYDRIFIDNYTEETKWFFKKRNGVIIPVSSMESNVIFSPIIFLNSLFYYYIPILAGLSFMVFAVAFIVEKKHVV